MISTRAPDRRLTRKSPTMWGAGELMGEITLVDELADEELHAACRLIDSRLPKPAQGLSMQEPHPDGHAIHRARLLNLRSA
jgi:hypothetical protein